MAKQVLAEDFSNTDALRILSDAAIATGNHGLAYNLLHRVTELEGPKAGVFGDMGNCHAAARNFDEAEKFYQKALDLEATVPSLVGMSYMALLKREPEEVIRYADKALAIDPNNRYARWNRALAYLAMGKWKEGWEFYDSSLGTQYRQEVQYGDEGRWDGTYGQTVVVSPEQGLGDEISFSSCIPDLIRVSKKVVVECDHRLERLYKRSFPEAEVYGTRHKKDSDWPSYYKFDGRVSLGSLPRFFRNVQDEFPGIRYLTACPDLRKGWRAILDGLPGMKIGVAWNGGVKHTNKENRSVPVSLFEPLKELGTLVSLEYKGDSEIPWIKDFPWIRDSDYDHTAALVAELDCVVSVTTAVVHLAGALGRPVHVLAPAKPRWFYGMTGNTVPWYSSMRIYRGEWAEQVQTIKEAISGNYRGHDSTAGA